MPGMQFESTPDDQLFSDEDPLTITIPAKKGAAADSLEAGGTFRCVDRWNPPVEDDDHDPRTRPVSFFFGILASQIEEDDRDRFTDCLIDAWENMRITRESLVDMVTWLREQREAAEKGTVARKVDRPTRARARSTR